jgi:hypothetical protein
MTDHWSRLIDGKRPFHQSDAKYFLGRPKMTPAHWLVNRSRTEPATPWAASRQALRLGHAFHFAVLGDGDRYEVVDATDWRSAMAKDMAVALWPEGVEVLLRKEADVIDAMAESVRACPDAAGLLAEGRAEVGFDGVEAGSGWPVAGRLDWVAPGALVDLKSVECADPAVFARKALDFCYHVQFAVYLDLAAQAGLEQTDFLFLLCEKEPPYACSVVRLDDEFLALGRRDYATACATYAACQTSGVFPAYQAGVHTVAPPHWARDSAADPTPGLVDSDLAVELAYFAD